MRTALVITAGRYADLPRLHAPRHDGRQLAEVLADPLIGGYRVEWLPDAKADRIRRRVNEVLVEAGMDDVVLLYFSGHGVKDVSGELYLAAVDTRRDLLPATGVSAAFVRDLVDRCRARQVLVWLDCCFGGAFPEGRTPKSGGDVDVVHQIEPPQGCAVMAASTAVEYAYERGGDVEGEPKGSYFTRALVAGLETGDADLDGDGHVDADELYRYVYQRVVAETPWQRPTRSGRVTGDLRVAKNPRGPRSGDTGYDIPVAPARRNRWRSAAYPAVAVLAAAATWFGIAASTGGDCASGTIRLVGNTAFAPALTALTRRYRQDCPAASILVETKGDLAGLREVAGAVDGVAAISDESADLPDLVSTPIAVGLYSVVANENVGVTTITSRQLHEIFDGTHVSWSTLGGRDVPIRLVGRGVESGIRRKFEDRLGAPEPPLSSDDCENATRPARVVRCERGTARQVLDVVDRVAGSVGYAVASDATPYSHVIRLKIDGREPDFGLAESSGYPFWSVLRLHTRGAPSKDVASFLRFLGGEAAGGMMLREHYLPCSTGGIRSPLCEG
ncbi:ABC-type phosphate transport system substrate-binding protein [Saccharothrix tamanrassetensis]|uniref:ABC-type phosphate transport system substrate-binding protein n=1 Tax=Saccharothrix tamanrassetensis TaxID=1051531 RepID=A0A841CK04_9PSEU|nr:caspase family protein [Saccharothrix tamanrassetensis]MBB5957293.1 ABC-type phosphate transport system substrate-binding protein [Saccharothrix tamanrassetensis]